MTIKVLSQELVPVLNTLVSSKQVINFTVNGDILDIQSFEPIINNRVVKLHEIVDKDDNYSLSVKLDGSFNLLDPGEVIISISDESISFMADDFFCRYASVYEERFVNNGSVVDNVEVRVNTFSHISRIAQGMSLVASSIGVDPPAVVFKNGKAYMLLSNIMWRIDAGFYDCILPISHLRAINKALGRSKYKMDFYGADKNYAVIEYDETSSICFPIRRDNSEVISTVESLLLDLKLVGKSSVASLGDQLKIVEKLYKNKPITMYIGSNGCRVEISEGTVSFLYIGKQKDSNIFATMRSTVAVLSLIYRVFGEYTFEVYTGGRYVCLKYDNQCLLLTGLQ